MDTNVETKACTSGRYDVVLLAASAGGIAALGTVLGRLSPAFPVGILVVQHLGAGHKSFLSLVLSRQTGLQVRDAVEGERIAAGTVYLAPTDCHLLVNPDCTLSLSHSEQVRYVRPSADVLFGSAATALGRRVLAVVLSGTGRDGADGVREIKKAGGTVIVQDEESAQFGGMPHNAIETGCADLVVPLEEIGSLLTTLVTKGVVHE